MSSKCSMLKLAVNWSPPHPPPLHPQGKHGTEEEDHSPGGCGQAGVKESSHHIAPPRADQGKPRSSPAAVVSASVGRRHQCTPTHGIVATPPPVVGHTSGHHAVLQPHTGLVTAKPPSSSSSSLLHITPSLSHLAQPSPRYVGREFTLQTPQSLGMR